MISNNSYRLSITSYKTILTLTAVFCSFFVISQTNTWTGSTDNDWHKACNWSLGTIPTASHNVTIPTASVYPVVSGNAHCRTLNITSTASNSLTINSSASGDLCISSTNGGACTTTLTDNGGCALFDPLSVSCSSGDPAPCPCIRDRCGGRVGCFKDKVNACLTSSLIPGNTYTFQFDGDCPSGAGGCLPGNCGSNPFIDLWGTNSCATPDHTTIPCPPSPWVYLGVSPALSSGGVSTYTITFTAPSAITKIHYGATCSFGGTTGVYRVQNVSLY